MDLQRLGGLQQVDLSVGDLTGAPDRPHPLRRWVADPLPLLGLLALAGLALAGLHLGGDPVPWAVPALLAVVAAGLALSGST